MMRYVFFNAGIEKERRLIFEAASPEAGANREVVPAPQVEKDEVVDLADAKDVDAAILNLSAETIVTVDAAAARTDAATAQIEQAAEQKSDDVAAETAPESLDALEQDADKLHTVTEDKNTQSADNERIADEIRSGNLEHVNSLSALTPDIAQSIIDQKIQSNDTKLINLSGLTSLDEGTARILAQFEGNISLNGLTTIDEATAKVLVEFKGDSLFLKGIEYQEGLFDVLTQFANEPSETVYLKNAQAGPVRRMPPEAQVSERFNVAFEEFANDYSPEKIAELQKNGAESAPSIAELNDLFSAMTPEQKEEFAQGPALADLNERIKPLGVSIKYDASEGNLKVRNNGGFDAFMEGMEPILEKIGKFFERVGAVFQRFVDRLTGKKTPPTEQSAGEQPPAAEGEVKTGDGTEAAPKEPAVKKVLVKAADGTEKEVSNEVADQWQVFSSYAVERQKAEAANDHTAKGYGEVGLALVKQVAFIDEHPELQQNGLITEAEIQQLRDSGRDVTERWNVLSEMDCKEADRGKTIEAVRTRLKDGFKRVTEGIATLGHMIVNAMESQMEGGWFRSFTKRVAGMDEQEIRIKNFRRTIGFLEGAQAAFLQGQRELIGNYQEARLGKAIDELLKGEKIFRVNSQFQNNDHLYDVAQQSIDVSRDIAITYATLPLSIFSAPVSGGYGAAMAFGAKVGMYEGIIRHGVKNADEWNAGNKSAEQAIKDTVSGVAVDSTAGAAFGAAGKAVGDLGGAALEKGKQMFNRSADAVEGSLQGAKAIPESQVFTPEQVAAMDNPTLKPIESSPMPESAPRSPTARDNPNTTPDIADSKTNPDAFQQGSTEIPSNVDTPASSPNTPQESRAEAPRQAPNERAKELAEKKAKEALEYGQRTGKVDIHGNPIILEGNRKLGYPATVLAKDKDGLTYFWHVESVGSNGPMLVRNVSGKMPVRKVIPYSEFLAKEVQTYVPPVFKVGDKVCIPQFFNTNGRFDAVGTVDEILPDGRLKVITDTTDRIVENPPNQLIPYSETDNIVL